MKKIIVLILFSVLFSDKTFEFNFENKPVKVKYITVSNKNYITSIDYGSNQLYVVCTTYISNFNIYDNFKESILIRSGQQYMSLYKSPIIHTVLFYKADELLKHRTN